MKKQDYTCSITANITAKEAFEKSSRAAKWWSTIIEGKTESLHDVFIYRHGKSVVIFKITEFIPGKRIVWHVSDCFLHDFKNDKEWKDTDVIFEISEQAGTSTINFTHKGLVPGLEVYDACVYGWDISLKSLTNFLTKGKGQPF